MTNHEKALEAHSSGTAHDPEATKALQHDASRPPTEANRKPIAEPSDEEIRKLLGNPHEFTRLFDQYFPKLHIEQKGADHADWIAESDLKRDLMNPNIKGEERLVAAASLALMDPLLRAFGNEPAAAFVLKKDADDYERYLGGASKSQLVNELEKKQFKKDGADTFEHWIDSIDPDSPVPTFIGAATGCLSVNAGAGIYGAALGLGSIPAIGLAAVGGLAAGAGLVGAGYGLARLDDYLHASSKYESTVKQLRLISQNASLPEKYRLPNLPE